MNTTADDTSDDTGDTNSGGTLDDPQDVDVMVPCIEHTFDTDKDDDPDDTEASERAQNRRLTLLQGGVKQRPPFQPGVPVSTTLPVVRDALRHGPPRKRYKPPHNLPPIWSATAQWTDLTVRLDLPTPTTDLPEGWTRQWAITYRHGKNDYTASVASVGGADLFAADPIRINSWHKNKTSRAGLRYMQTTGRHHAHESMFERKLLCALDYHGATDVLSQPFTLTWHDGTRERNHTPDFLVHADGQIIIINTRPAQLVKPRLIEDCGAVAEVALSRGWDHALVVGYPTPGFTIIDTVSAHTNSFDHLGYTDDILDTLDTHGPLPFAEVCNRMGSPVMGRAVLQRLIWERQVSLDLTLPLEDHTLVALPGTEVRP